MATDTKIVTYEEWLLMPEVTDGREEVVNGEIIRLLPNKLEHALVASEIKYHMERSLQRSQYWVLDSNFGLVVRTEPLTCRTPDVAVFRRADPVVVNGYFHSAPELAVEVLSPGNTRREREEKLADYASIAVPEVWVVSPEARTVEILVHSGSSLTTESILREGTLRPKRLPEAAVDIVTIWP